MENKEEQPTITEILKDLMEARNVGVEALSHSTDIPTRFIVCLLKEDFDKLPAQPYVRGYLFKIAEVLDIEPAILWQAYRRTTDVASSGEHDFLPANRFAIKKIRLGKVVLVVAGLIVAGFIGFRMNSILGNPTIDLDIPESTGEEVISIKGSVRPGDSLTLDGEVIYPNEDGGFVKEVRLDPGLNTFEFGVKRYLGREQSFIRQIFYQPN